jgi:hypothetical protein
MPLRRFLKILIAVGLCGLHGCAYYRVHIKSIPSSDYDVTINGKYRGKLPLGGDTTLDLSDVSMFKGQVLEIRKDSLYGKIRIDYNGNASEKRNVRTVGSRLENMVYYDIVFDLNPLSSPENRELLHQKQLVADLDSSFNTPRTISAPDVTASDSTSKTMVQIMNCDSSFSFGYTNAKTSYNPGGWVAMGFWAGFAWPFIGTGLTVSFAACSHPSPDRIPASVNKDCYSKGYEKEARKKRVLGTIFGNIGGIAAVVGLIAAVALTNP